MKIDEKTQSASASLGRVADLAETLCGRLRIATTSIATITDHTRMLSLNARIEAARAGGSTGEAFSVVASAITDLANRTASVTGELRRETEDLIDELLGVNRHLAIDFRGSHLADAALTAMDLIDRNLYERSCDCRWWATDAAAVDALTTPTAATSAHARSRLGIILDSYTVYCDIVLADASGRVIANGRPGKYSSTGANVSDQPWFVDAMRTLHGQEFAFQSAHASNLIGGQHALIYSAAVRAGGETNGRPLGVLGVLFDWAPFSQRILDGAPIDPAERSTTQVCIVDSKGLLLADSKGGALREHLRFSEFEVMLETQRGYRPCEIGTSTVLVAHGRSPGFETYATGWHAFILQQLSTAALSRAA
jgi:hypothetical protein